MKRERMTETELSFLKLVDRYGGGFDVTSARIGKALKAAAITLLARGHLSGKRKALSLTPAGRRAISGDSNE